MEVSGEGKVTDSLEKLMKGHSLVKHKFKIPKFPFILAVEP